jgi:hypothetical protein
VVKIWMWLDMPARRAGAVVSTRETAAQRLDWTLGLGFYSNRLLGFGNKANARKPCIANAWGAFSWRRLEILVQEVGP